MSALCPLYVRPMPALFPPYTRSFSALCPLCPRHGLAACPMSALCPPYVRCMSACQMASHRLSPAPETARLSADWGSDSHGPLRNGCFPRTPATGKRRTPSFEPWLPALRAPPHSAVFPAAALSAIVRGACALHTRPAVHRSGTILSAPFSPLLSAPLSPLLSAS